MPRLATILLIELWHWRCRGAWREGEALLTLPLNQISRQDTLGQSPAGAEPEIALKNLLTFKDFSFQSQDTLAPPKSFRVLRLKPKIQ